MASRMSVFSTAEKRILVELVEKNKSVIDNKKTDAATCEKKRAAWKMLTEEFNSNWNVTKRDERQLKRCWEKMKCQMKKQKAIEMGQSVGVEVRPFVEDDETPSASRIESLVPHINLCIAGAEDSDHHHLSSKNSISASPSSNASKSPQSTSGTPLMPPEEARPDAIPSPFAVKHVSSSIHAEDEEDSSMHKKFLNPRKKLRHVSAILEEELRVRLELLQEEKKQKKREHELKMKILEEDLERVKMKRKIAEAKLLKLMKE